ncbi:hypothetical protein MF406_17450 [Georgenia sp. TF02-10]|uniref:hypothetical protein n=1 Tax=Georgenia sp. TF02-10 TaxID=2917725 RepID=UPI001FA6FBEA|nr:hypothetical protein [Georgenia sp. TF02-10]UNX54636.1 hypothetical protein MF406_17450 [Georgenia sp. TF02-10]
MRHPSEGVLRRLLDEPAGVTDADRDHVAGCGQCLGDLAALRRADPGEATAAPGGTTSAEGLPATASGAVGSTGARRSPGARRSRAARRGPAAAGLAVAVVLAGAGAAAANGWLPIFRTEQVAPVTVTDADLADLVELPDLSAYGDVEVVDEADMAEVTDVAAAEEATGLDVPQVGELPQGVTGEPELKVGGPASAEFTFSAAEAAQATAETGETLPPPPAGLDGSRFRLEGGPGVAAVWSSNQDVPALVVARAVAPTVDSSGVPFAAARDYLLSLPGLPEDLAAQLRALDPDGSTLPLPVPADEVTTSQAQVDGVPATVLVARDQTVAAVVWVDDGVVTAVGGALGADEVLSVAEDLR